MQPSQAAVGDELVVQGGWTVARELPAWSDSPTVLVSLQKPYAAGLGEVLPEINVIEVSSVWRPVR